MFDNETITPLESEELARSRIWERVRAGMVAHARRRRIHAIEALALGATVTTLVLAVLGVI